MCIVPILNYPLFFSDFVNFELSGQIFEIYSIIKLHKNPCLVGPEVFHADRQI